MKVIIKAFGVAAEICGSRQIEMDLPNECSVILLKQHLVDTYPNLKELMSYRIAVNHTYESDSFVLKSDDEVAIIPPVSGG